MEDECIYIYIYTNTPKEYSRDFRDDSNIYSNNRYSKKMM